MSVVATHVVLLLAVAADPSAKVVSHAAVDSLSAPFVEPPRVVLRQLGEPPASPIADALAREVRADSVVILTCAGNGCAQADVRVTDGAGHMAARSVRFLPADALGERGRAIGLLASTLLPEGWSRLPPGPPPLRAAAPPAAPVVVEAPAASAPLPRARWAVETAATLFTAPSGGPSDFGLALGARRAIAGGLAARLAAKLELGDLPANGGANRGFGGALGLGWTSAGLERPGHFGVGAQADFVMLYRRMRLDNVPPDDGSTATRSVTLSSLGLGGDAVGFIGYALSTAAALTAGIGAELLSSVAGNGEDDVQLGAHQPPELRWIAEVGVLARF